MLGAGVEGCFKDAGNVARKRSLKNLLCLTLPVLLDHVHSVLFLLGPRGEALCIIEWTSYLLFRIQSIEVEMVRFEIFLKPRLGSRVVVVEGFLWVEELVIFFN